MNEGMEDCKRGVGNLTNEFLSLWFLVLTSIIPEHLFTWTVFLFGRFSMVFFFST